LQSNAEQKVLTFFRFCGFHKIGVEKTVAKAVKKEILFERSELISFRLLRRFLAKFYAPQKSVFASFVATKEERKFWECVCSLA
jgi:hypothetical protein